MKSTAPKMIMRGGGANDSMNTADRVLARFAVRAVVAGRREPGLELAERVAGDDAIEVGVAERAERVDRRAGRAASPRGSGPAMTVASATGSSAAQRVAQRLVDRTGRRRHQSSGSTKRWIVPPHVSPTANASSSE